MTYYRPNLMLDWRPNDYMQRRVLEFMKAANLSTSDTPTTDIPFYLLRKIVREEFEEFDFAIEDLRSSLTRASQDKVREKQALVIDAICDCIVVLHNTSNAMGIDILPFFDEVHRSNMAKIGGPVRADGKQLKPRGWQPPALKDILEEQYKECEKRT